MNPDPFFDLDPDAFFLPLAVEFPERFRTVDPWMLGRRIPDFLHHLVNQADPIPTAMLEVQTPHQDGDDVQWVEFSEPPVAEEAFSMLPVDCPAHTVMTGSLNLDHEGLAIELIVHNREGGDQLISSRIAIVADMKDPVPALCRLAQHLARLLGVDFREPPKSLLTSSGSAFFRFLAGLDGSALLSGDLEIEVREDASILMKPYREALGLDPHFGLALRSAQSTLFTALDDARIGPSTCCELIDGLLSKMPVDGDGCVQVADHLSGLGEEQRARAWLEHAAHLSPPPPKGLENLGILCANSGDVIEARNLWLHGLDQDGHPDFLAHLARLSFGEGKLEDAWDQVLRGLRRIYERCARAGEWLDEGRDLGLMLRYLVDHLHDHDVPADVREAILDLRALLAVAEDQLDLGRCLLELGQVEDARHEFESALGGDLDPNNRDDGVRLLLALDVPDFDRRFATVSDSISASVDLEESLVELEVFLAAQPEFWPGEFLKAMAEQRQGRDEDALDSLARTLRLCPGQPDALSEMGRLFDQRGNPKRALECVEEAVESRPDDASLYVSMAIYLERLGRVEEARSAIDTAHDLAPDDEEVRAEWRRLSQV